MLASIPVVFTVDDETAVKFDSKVLLQVSVTLLVLLRQFAGSLLVKVELLIRLLLLATNSDV